MNKSSKKLLRSFKLSTKSPFPLLRLPVAFGSSKNKAVLRRAKRLLRRRAKRQSNFLFKPRPVVMT